MTTETKKHGISVGVFSFFPPGVILPYGGTSSISGSLLCNGSIISRTTYSNLYANIGDAFGGGDGSTTFHLPDLRGRFLRGVDGGINNDPDRTSRTASNTGGNTGDAVGTLQGDAFKTHNHPQSSQSLPLANAGSDWSASPANGSANAISTGSTGGNETRPKNVYCNYIITTGDQ